MSSKRICENCECFKEINTLAGNCCAVPPVLIIESNERVQPYWGQPEVGRDDNCFHYFEPIADADADFMEVVEGGKVTHPVADTHMTDAEKLAVAMGEPVAKRTAKKKSTVKK